MRNLVLIQLALRTLGMSICRLLLIIPNILHIYIYIFIEIFHYFSACESQELSFIRLAGC